MKNKKVLHIDNKKRITVGKLVTNDVTGFQVCKNPDGTILLTPISAISENESWVYKHKKSLKSLRKSLLDLKKGLTIKIDSSFWVFENDEHLDDLNFTNEFLKNLEPILDKNDTKTFEAVKSTLLNLDSMPRDIFEKTQTKSGSDIFQTDIGIKNYKILWTIQDDEAYILDILKLVTQINKKR